MNEGNKNSMNDKALKFIRFMISEERSDLDCVNILNNCDYDKEDNEDYSWKRERIELLQYIECCLLEVRSL